jgi:hypothetical protein
MGGKLAMLTQIKVVVQKNDHTIGFQEKAKFSQKMSLNIMFITLNVAKTSFYNIDAF